MNEVNIKYDELGKHRMPQYSGQYDIIPQEKEREIWLRIPVEISNHDYRISLFVQSKININKISSFGKVEDVAYFISVSYFTDKISELSQWNVLSMEDIYPIYKFDMNLLNGGLPKELPYKFNVMISNQFNEYLTEIYSKIEKAVEALNHCKEYLGKTVQSSTSSGFKYFESEIRQYLSYIDTCARNMSTHSHKTHRFNENLRKIERGFGELIKRKQVNNSNYQYYLDEIRTSIYSLGTPDAWDGRIPTPPILQNF